MPRDPFKPLLPREQTFVFHWVREGCHAERMRIVERKAKLKSGEGSTILARAHVQREIESRKALVDLEQARLIARDQNRNAEKEDRRREVTIDHIEARLTALMDLDVKTHGSLVHAAVQTAMVYSGVVRSQRLERTIPIKDPTGDPEGTAASSVYAAVFAGDPPPGAPVPLPDQTPAPLHPSETKLPPAPPPAPAPPRRPIPAPAAPAAPAPAPKRGVEVELS